MAYTVPHFIHYKEEEYRVGEFVGEFEDIPHQEGLKERSYATLQKDWKGSMLHYLVVENKLFVAKGLMAGGYLTLQNWKERRFLPLTGHINLHIDGENKFYYEEKWQLHFEKGELKTAEDLNPELIVRTSEEQPLRYFQGAAL